MNIDPEREVTITLPYGMVLQLKSMTPTLSMFRDERDVRAVIEIIEAIHTGAIEFIRQEDGDIMDYLAEAEDTERFLNPDDDDDDDEDKSDA